MANSGPEKWLAETLITKIISDLESAPSDGKRTKHEFMGNPSGWLREHPWILDQKFDGSTVTSKDPSPVTDIEFVTVVSDLLKSKELRSKSKLKPCPPIWVAIALVTEEHLMKLHDPIKSAIKLRAAIRDCAEIGTLYPQEYENLLKVPTEFAVSLLNECLSREEVMHLMDIGTNGDRSVIGDLLAGKNKQIIERPIYRSLYREKIFWREAGHENSFKDSFTFQYGLIRSILLLFWNIIYPISAAIQKYSGTITTKLPGIYQKRLFSPISCFIADLTNYLIMVALIIGVMLEFKYPKQETTKELVKQFKAGNVTLDHHRLEETNATDWIHVELEKYPMTHTGWALFACYLSRVLFEIFQLSNLKKWVIQTDCSGVEPCLNKIKEKIQCYWKSDMNKIDVLLLASLTMAIGIEFHYTYSSESIYARVCIKKEGCDDNVDFTLEARRVIYMNNFYSLSGLLALVRIFYCVFLFIPIIGPILRSIQKMMKDVTKVVIILLFFSAGFFVPLFAIIQSYFAVHHDLASPREDTGASDPDNDEEVFKTMKSPSSGFITMLLSITEGKLTYSDDVYDSKDNSTKLFLFIIMFIYFIVFGLLCLNLLIALISKRYDVMMQSRNKDWRFAQFDLLVDYGGTDPNDGMPFFFPFCIWYIIWRLFLRSFYRRLVGLYEGYEKPDAERDLRKGSAEISLEIFGCREKFVEILMKRRKARSRERLAAEQGQESAASEQPS